MTRDPLDPPNLDERYEDLPDVDLHTVTGRFVGVELESEGDMALLTLEVEIAAARRLGCLLNSPAVLSVVEES